MKAILVVDIDDDIRNYGVTVYHYPSRRFVYSMDANLKPLPKKKTEEEEMAKDPFNEDLFYDEYIWGWNACLDAITGETE